MDNNDIIMSDIKDSDELGDILYTLVNEGHYGISGTPYSDEALVHIYEDLKERGVNITSPKHILRRYKETSVKDALGDYGYTNEEELMEHLDPICLKSGLILVID